ncbi:ProQ/FinO family protein [Trinickia mobilis]|uniref:ProQ/FinO family protein n=1 Tax=Trinickia mobilis TaxID=2816356 RepID=UPI001A8C2F7E|nr:ProQ/FinO family protein [Trinickia mobilis]
MGFEQLAELKEQLAKRAEVKRAARLPRARRATPPANSKTVDPVVRTIGKLQKRFPDAFPKNPAPKVPLKVGIFDDLLIHATELALSDSELRDAIRIWCRGSRYWTCLVEGAVRVDLAGGAAGRVSQAEAAGALKLEANRLARAASKSASSKKIV